MSVPVEILKSPNNDDQRGPPFESQCLKVSDTILSVTIDAIYTSCFITLFRPTPRSKNYFAPENIRLGNPSRRCRSPPFEPLHCGGVLAPKPHTPPPRRRGSPYDHSRVNRDKKKWSGRFNHLSNLVSYRHFVVMKGEISRRPMTTIIIATESYRLFRRTVVQRGVCLTATAIHFIHESSQL